MKNKTATEIGAHKRTKQFQRVKPILKLEMQAWPTHGQLSRGYVF